MKRFTVFAFACVLGWLGFVSGICSRCWEHGTIPGPCVDNKCPCKEGYKNDICSWCLKIEGYHGNGKVCCKRNQFHNTDVSCEDCGCNENGVAECTGKRKCTCKKGYRGELCNECEELYDLLDNNTCQLSHKVKKIGYMAMNEHRYFKIGCNGTCKIQSIYDTFSSGGFMEIHALDDENDLCRFCQGIVSAKSPQYCQMFETVSDSEFHVELHAYQNSEDVILYSIVDNIISNEEYWKIDCGCNPEGVENMTCKANGECFCKKNYRNKKCDGCEEGYDLIDGNRCQLSPHQALKFDTMASDEYRYFYFYCYGYCDIESIYVTFDSGRVDLTGYIDYSKFRRDYVCLGNLDTGSPKNCTIKASTKTNKFELKVYTYDVSKNVVVYCNINNIKSMKEIFRKLY